MERPSSNRAPGISALPAIYKGRLDFCIGTTSFICPADWTTNIKWLGPFFDEIELLFFDSRHPDDLPEPPVIDQMAALADSLPVDFNLHLPTDIDPVAVDPMERKRSVQVLKDTLALTAPLKAASVTLHLPLAGRQRTARDISEWQRQARESLQQLLDTGLIVPSCICLETLDYPVRWLDPLMALGVSLCMDIGHLLIHGQDLESLWREYGTRTGLIHLHGVAAERDHVGLNHLDSATRDTVAGMLTGFRGAVMIEVFGFDTLAASLPVLDSITGIQPPPAPAVISDLNRNHPKLS